MIDFTISKFASGFDGRKSGNQWGALAVLRPTIIFFVLILLSLPSTALDISISSPTNTSSRGNVFAADDFNATKWINENLKIESNGWINIGIPFYQYGFINLQHDRSRTTLYGSVGKYVCVFFGCGWIDEKFFRNENANGTIQVDLDIFSIFFSGPQMGTAVVTVNPKIGGGLAIAKGRLQRVEEDQKSNLTLPLLFFGFNAAYSFGKIGYASLEYEISGISYDHGKVSRDRVGMYFMRQMAKDILIFSGIHMTSMKLRHAEGSSHISHASRTLQPRVGIKITF